MKDISYFSKIYLAIKPVDFRKQVTGLSAIVSGEFNLNCFENRSIFIFTNKNKSALKMLYWDSTGFAIWMKKLEKERFKWPKSKVGAHKNLTSKEVKWLLQGIDITKIKIHQAVDFNTTF